MTGLPLPLITVGHSNHPLDAFLALLRTHAVALVADVRSSPYSRYLPHFNREPLASALAAAGLDYLFLGRELGARREESECYEAGKARYALIARSPLFHQGLDRVRAEAARRRVALLCAERDPLTCHRMILVCRHLREDFPSIEHIREDGRLESHADAETRLLTLCGLPDHDLFHSRADFLERAYDRQGERIAYAVPDPRATEDLP